MPFDDHRCSAFCRDGRHADLVYSNRDDPDWVGRCYQDALTAARIPERVVTVEPAREAPPLARAVDAGMVEPWCYNADDPGRCFRLDDATAYADHPFAWVVWYAPGEG